MSNWAERGEIVMNSTLSNFDELLITDPYNYISEQTANERSDNIFRKSPDMFLDYLRDSDLVQGLVESFASPMREVLNKNTIQISFKDEEMDSKYSDFINNKIAEIDLRSKMIDSLFDVIYRGAFFKLLTYNKERKTFNVIDVKDPWKTVFVERLGKPMGYMRNGNFIDLSEGIFSAYSLAIRKRVTLDKVNVPQLKDKIISDIGKRFEGKYEIDITAYTHFLARSVFWGQAQKLFQIYLNDFILQFLALKDSIRQDLITVTVQSLPKKVINTAKVTQAIEDAINQGSNLMVQQDPQSMLSQVIFSLFNSARVLPSVENYSAINKLDLIDLKEKRAQLMAENEELKKQLLANLGIPEELQAGTGNRWEILSRSDKFLTAINSYIAVFDDIVKSTVVSMMRLMGRYCEPEDVNFSFINDTPLQSQMSRNKAALFIDSLRDTLTAINAVKTILSTGFVDSDKVVHEFLEQIQNWNLPFASSYLSEEDLIAALKDPQNPATQLSMVEF